MNVVLYHSYALQGYVLATAWTNNMNRLLNTPNMSLYELDIATFTPRNNRDTLLDKWNTHKDNGYEYKSTSGQRL